MYVTTYWVKLLILILDFSVLFKFQVMSNSVPSALRFTFGDIAEQTACFVEKVDK